AWFQKLEVPEVKLIKPENRWNMDEAGIMEGQGSNGLVVGSKTRRFIQRKQPGSKAWTSFIKCISAMGLALPPLVMFKGKTVQQQWFPTSLELYNRWQFTATENGWTSDATAREWLEKVFIPATAPQDPRDPRLLILDGHGSHETTEFMWLCFQYKIQLLFLPPHTSHVLQPLDLSIFSPLKAAYRKELSNLSLLTDSTPVGKRNFLRCYKKARDASLTSSNIKAGWKATGLWPPSIAKPLMSRLLLENSNNGPQDAQNSLIGDLQPFTDQMIPPVLMHTPKAAKEVRVQVETISRLGNSKLSTSRRLFRKLEKGFDEKDYALTQAQLRIDQLEARLEQLAPRKRRQVRTSPNSKFADIQAIKEAQIGAGDREIEEEDSNSSIESASTGDYIEVEE
ncbi:hypothetical protein LSUB1_G008693, partial [Lachnellula subtilissima]